MLAEMIFGTHYTAFVRGENFLIDGEQGVQLLGFYTWRSVYAASPEAAEKKVVSMIQEDERLLMITEDDIYPTVYIEEMYEIAWWKKGNNTGYTFFDMDKIDE